MHRWGTRRRTVAPLVVSAIAAVVVSIGSGPAEAVNPGGDTTFGVGGDVLLPLDDLLGTHVNAVVSDLAVDRDGRLLVAIVVQNGASSPGEEAPVVKEHGLIVRLLPSGALDPTFGTNGHVIHAGPRSVVPLANHEIMVGLGGQITLLRANGERDPSTPEFAGPPGPSVLRRQFDGSIVGVRSVPVSGSNPLRFTSALYRFDGATGQTISAVDIDGTLPIGDFDGAGPALVQRRGRVLVLTRDQAGCAITALTAQGDLDLSFAAGRLRPTVTVANPVDPATPLVEPMAYCRFGIFPDDSIVVSGSRSSARDAQIHAFGPNGEPSTFESTPFIREPASTTIDDIALSGGGRIVTVGSINAAPDSGTFVGNFFGQSDLGSGQIDTRLGPTGNYQVDYGGLESYDRVITSPFGGQFAAGIVRNSVAPGAVTRELVVSKLTGTIGTAPDLGSNAPARRSPTTSPSPSGRRPRCRCSRSRARISSPTSMATTCLRCRVDPVDSSLPTDRSECSTLATALEHRSPRSVPAARSS